MITCTANIFSKVMTILANEAIIAGNIGPAINFWLTRQGQLMISWILSWPYWASKVLIAGPIGLAIITSLAKNVLTLLKSLENPGPYLQIGLGWVLLQRWIFHLVVEAMVYNKSCAAVSCSKIYLPDTCVATSCCVLRPCKGRWSKD